MQPGGGCVDAGSGVDGACVARVDVYTTGRHGTMCVFCVVFCVAFCVLCVVWYVCVVWYCRYKGGRPGARREG